jgi:hypothetical protein
MVIVAYRVEGYTYKSSQTNESKIIDFGLKEGALV